MRLQIDKEAEPEMRDEYDFSGGVRGKHARRYARVQTWSCSKPTWQRYFQTPRR